MGVKCDHFILFNIHEYPWFFLPKCTNLHHILSRHSACKLAKSNPCCMWMNYRDWVFVCVWVCSWSCRGHTPHCSLTQAFAFKDYSRSDLTASDIIDRRRESKETEREEELLQWVSFHINALPHKMNTVWISRSSAPTICLGHTMTEVKVKGKTITKTHRSHILIMYIKITPTLILNSTTNHIF